MAYDSLVLLSGGPDSAVALAMAKEEGSVAAFHVRYNQRNRNSEMYHVRKLAEYYGVALHVAVLFGVFGGSSYLEDGQRREDELVGDPNELESNSPAEVYFRNGVFASIGASKARELEAKSVWLSTHLRASGKGSLYPDSTNVFARNMAKAIHFGLSGSVQLKTPFAMATKANIIREGDRLRVPWELTYSCYLGRTIGQHCGECFACTDRKLAFEAAKVEDPIWQTSPS